MAEGCRQAVAQRGQVEIHGIQIHPAGLNFWKGRRISLINPSNAGHCLMLPMASRCSAVVAVALHDLGIAPEGVSGVRISWLMLEKARLADRRFRHRLGALAHGHFLGATPRGQWRSALGSPPAAIKDKLTSQREQTAAAAPASLGMDWAAMNCGMGENATTSAARHFQRDQGVGQPWRLPSMR